MSLEELIAEVNRRGLRVCDLHQTRRCWRASLRADRESFMPVDGDTAAEALQKALAKVPERFFKSEIGLEDLL